MEKPAIDLTVMDLLHRAVALWGDRPYVFFEDRVYSFQDLQTERSRVTAALASLGVRDGDRVAALLPNSPAFLFVWFGAIGRGAALVPINPSLTPREVGEIVRISACSVLVVAKETHALASEALADLEGRVTIVPVEELSRAQPDPGSDERVTPDAPVVLLATSGTTGSPKLVVQTHRAYAMTGESFPWWLGIDSTDRMMVVLPLFHLNAQAYSTLGSLWSGAGLVLVPRFSARNFWEQTRRYGVTQFNSIGAVLEILTRQGSSPRDSDNPVRLCYTAPAPTSEEQQSAIERRFAMQIMIGYALSESPFGTIWPLHGPRPYGSIGKARQHPRLGHVNDVRIVDDSGGEVGPGEEGELLLRNPAVMDSYFGNRAETDRTLVDGWLHTGDLVRLGGDDNLYFIARKKEVIRRRGENISPAEVENALTAHPAVMECAVVAVPSDLGEDDVKAFLVAAQALDGDLVDELVDWSEDRLARHKIPRYWQAVDELPYTSTGRIAKFKLDRDRTDREIDHAEIVSKR